MKVFTLISSCALSSLLLLSGCSTNTAGNYQPIVDGPRNAQYSADLAACQQLAQQRSYANDDVKTAAVVGGVLGAIAADVDDDKDAATPLEGLVAGAAAAGAGRALDTRDERKAIIIKCMQGRGHRVVG